MSLLSNILGCFKRTKSFLNKHAQTTQRIYKTFIKWQNTGKVRSPRVNSGIFFVDMIMYY